MHLNILNQDQQKLLPLLSKFKKEFYLVGGTAIALHIGHRLSIDFDLFKKGKFSPKKVLAKFEENNEKANVTLNMEGQLNLISRNVKFTFFNYDFIVEHKVQIENFISIPSLLDLAAMKAYALGRRAKWKDYVDLYFLIKNNFTINEISERATIIYGDLFSQKLFRGQLNYFKGINYDEKVEYMPGFKVSDKTIKDFLTNAALEGF
jgi:hypothetical protein